MSLRSRITRRLWKRVLVHPAVFLPALIGGTALAMFLSTRAPVLSVAAVCLAVAAVAAAFRYQRHGAVFGAEEEERLRGELQQSDRATLVELRQALQLDRNREGVHDVDRLEKLSDRLDRGRAGEGFRIPDELEPTLVSLRDACVGMLRKVVRLGGVAQDLSTPAAKDQVTRMMATLLVDAREATDQLGRTLDQLQLRAVRDDTAESELGDIRGELDAQLEVARSVEMRLEDLERSLAPDVRDR